MDEVGEFRSTILARQIEAEEAFVNGDPGPRMELWSKRDPVTLFGAIGMSESGWEKLSQTFSWVASRFSDVSDFRFDVKLVDVSGDMAYTLGFERFNGSVAGRPVEPVTVWSALRTSTGERTAHGRSFAATPTTRVVMAEENRRAFVAAPGDGQILKNPVGGPLTLTARGEQTGGALTVFETTPAPGEGPPLHRHAREDEVLYVLQGRFRVKLEATIQEAPAGSFVFIPSGIPHTWQNAGDDPARLLVLFAPAAPGMEQFFERSATLGDDARVADAFKKFANDAGMEVLGPPLAQSDAAS